MHIHMYNEILHYSAIKENEILSFTGKQMEVKDVILSEVSQVQKDKCHMFSHICWRQTQIQVLPYNTLYAENVRLLEETKGGGREEENNSE
jgi:hypothetical protein